MNLRELYYNHSVKLVALNGKTRLTKKTDGYAVFNNLGMIEHPASWKRIENNIDNYGVLCEYVPDLGLYYSVLDIDSKDFPVKQVLEEFPTAMTLTKHGAHLHYLSKKPVELKQLTGKEKERCQVDIRGQRRMDKEGNYARLSKLIGDTTPLLVCDFNKVIKYVYGLFNIEAKKIGENEGNIEGYTLKNTTDINLTKDELFVAHYLYYQKEDWSSAYDTAFPAGIRLSGQYDDKTLQRIAEKLMSVSGYPRPRKWIRAFMTGAANGKKGRPHFAKGDLNPAMRDFLARRFSTLSGKEIGVLAEQLKDVKLYQILEVIR